MMADYDTCDPRSQTVAPSLEIPVSSSQQLPIATSCESIWEGWTQTPPVSGCALMEQLQQLSGCTNGSKSVNPCQPDLLSSWLMSGFQSAGTHHQQEGEGTGMTAYQDEFSRMNIMSCSSSSEQQGPAAWSDVAHQLYVIPCSSSAQNTCNLAEEEQSTQFLRSPPSIENSQSKVNHCDQQILQQMTATELSSRTSPSSPPAVLSSYGQMIQQLVGQFDNSSYWASSSVTTSSQQPPNCSGAMPFTGQHIDHSNHSNDGMILRPQISSNLKRGFEGSIGLPSPDADVSDQMHMYAELHGLLTRNLEVPGPADHQSALCSSNPAVSTVDIRNCADQPSWTQFGVDPMAIASVGPSQAGLVGIQHVDQTMFEATNNTPNELSTAAKQDDLSPSTAGTDISTINNLKAATTATDHDAGHHPLPHGSADLDHDSLEGLQRKSSSRGSEHVANNGISAEESVKRSSIVRCVWEQNIAQLQLANVPSDHHRNLWHMQSQALFGKIPSNLLLGSSSSPGSVDMHAAVGPALNTNGRPRARRGSATDPQSVYARHRRERIKDRLKVLQHLVPNGAKVDIVTMLEEAINYVKFLQVQVRLLSSDELWIYAPTTYNGVDVSMGMHAGLLNPQA